MVAHSVPSQFGSGVIALTKVKKISTKKNLISIPESRRKIKKRRVRREKTSMKSIWTVI